MTTVTYKIKFDEDHLEKVRQLIEKYDLKPTPEDEATIRKLLNMPPRFELVEAKP